MTARAVPDRTGRPICGVDLGAGRAFSAAAAVFPNGRVECVAVMPGIPPVETQEKRDRVPGGTYRRLVDAGLLTVAEGLRVQPVGALIDRIRPWRPSAIVCDRFRLGELLDTKPPAVVVPRVTRWSEATFDIRALRKMAKDGPLAVAPESRPLLQASLAVFRVQNDDGGSIRMMKDGVNNTGRDDVSAALVLGCRGAGARSAPAPRALPRDRVSRYHASRLNSGRWARLRRLFSTGMAGAAGSAAGRDGWKSTT